MADYKGHEAGILFSSGYAANLGVLQALGRCFRVFFSDQLNHATIIDGTRLARTAGAEVRIFAHSNTEELDVMLAESAGEAIVLTCGIYSMDGDLAPVGSRVMEPPERTSSAHRFHCIGNTERMPLKEQYPCGYSSHNWSTR